MFDRLFEFLAQVWHYLLPFTVVDQYESALVLRFGVHHRTLAPGLRWHWPLAERVLTDHVTPAPHMLEAQSLTTQDGVQCVVRASVVYRIVDMVKYHLDCEGQSLTLQAAAGSISRAVSRTPWAELPSKPFARELALSIRRQAAPYGVQVLRVNFQDLSRARAIRLFGHAVAPVHVLE